MTVVPKKRSEWWLYASLVLSFGLFGFVWPVLMARDVNELQRRPVFPVVLLGLSFGVGGMIYLSAGFGVPAVINDKSTRLVILIAVSLLLYALQIALLILVYRQSRIMANLPFGAQQVAAVIALHLLMQLSFVIVQQSLNSTIERGKLGQE